MSYAKSPEELPKTIRTENAKSPKLGRRGRINPGQPGAYEINIALAAGRRSYRIVVWEILHFQS